MTEPWPPTLAERIRDMLTDQPATVAQLARADGTPPPHVRRALRALEQHGHAVRQAGQITSSGREPDRWMAALPPRRAPQRQR